MRGSRSLCVQSLALVVTTLAIAGEARAADFKKGPFVQALTDTAVTVKVELSGEAPAIVAISGAGGTTREVPDATSARFHAIRVDGLTPQTTYEYRVRSGESTSSAGHFTTAPSDGRPFRFVVYGDSRSDRDAHLAVVRAIQASPSALLVNTGDMVAKGDLFDEWDEFFKIEGDLLRDRCVFACVGNHELAGGQVGAAAFLTYFAPDGDGRAQTTLYGSFRWSNTRFFMLNAMDEWTGDERAWLASALDRAMTEPGLLHRIAVLHHGPFSSGPHGGNARLASGGVVDLMRDRKVDLVLAGHDHIYERGEGQGLKYVITGGAGAPLYERGKRAPETITFEPVHHFLEVSIDGDAINIVAKRVSGSVIEACGFHGSSPWQCDGASPSQAPTSSPGSAPPVSPSTCHCSTPGAPKPLSALWLTIVAPVVAAFRRTRRKARRS